MAGDLQDDMPATLFGPRVFSLTARGLPQMRTPDQYREFAAECYRLAAEAKTEKHQKILQEMARAWSEVAEEAEAEPLLRRR
jgi:hypothetical protein